MTYRFVEIFYQNNLNLNFFFYLESRIQSQITIKYKIDRSFPQKYYSPSFIKGDFTQRLLQNIEKMILR